MDGYESEFESRQADAVAFGATPTTEHGARIGGSERKYLINNPVLYAPYNLSPKDAVNDPVIRRLLQTLAAANVQEPEFSAIKKILERGVERDSEENAREAERLARRTWFELIWDRLFNHVE